ncbi:unnamed protein product, partial [Pylaiella littoralis]
GFARLIVRPPWSPSLSNKNVATNRQHLGIHIGTYHGRVRMPDCRRSVESNSQHAASASAVITKTISSLLLRVSSFASNDSHVPTQTLEGYGQDASQTPE